MGSWLLTRDLDCMLNGDHWDEAAENRRWINKIFGNNYLLGFKNKKNPLGHTIAAQHYKAMGN